MNSCPSVYLRMETQSDLTWESSGIHEQLCSCSPRISIFLMMSGLKLADLNRHMLSIVTHLRLEFYNYYLIVSITISAETFLVVFSNPLSSHCCILVYRLLLLSQERRITMLEVARIDSVSSFLFNYVICFTW